MQLQYCPQQTLDWIIPDLSTIINSVNADHRGSQQMTAAYREVMVWKVNLVSKIDIFIVYIDYNVNIDLIFISIVPCLLAAVTPIWTLDLSSQQIAVAAWGPTN